MRSRPSEPSTVPAAFRRPFRAAGRDLLTGSECCHPDSVHGGSLPPRRSSVARAPDVDLEALLRGESPPTFDVAVVRLRVLSWACPSSRRRRIAPTSSLRKVLYVKDRVTTDFRSRLSVSAEVMLISFVSASSSL